jgi:hypothetical protein
LVGRSVVAAFGSIGSRQASAARVKSLVISLEKNQPHQRASTCPYIYTYERRSSRSGERKESAGEAWDPLSGGPEGRSARGRLLTTGASAAQKFPAVRAFLSLSLSHCIMLCVCIEWIGFEIRMRKKIIYLCKNSQQGTQHRLLVFEMHRLDAGNYSVCVAADNYTDARARTGCVITRLALINWFFLGLIVWCH